MAIYALGNLEPKLGKNVYVADTAVVLGDVEIGEGSSIWFGTVVRGDMHWIRIGKRTNIQDNSMVHVTTGRWPTKLGDSITVGHSVTLHGCTIGDRTLVGIGSIVLDGAEIGEECLIGAGSLVTPGMKVPPRSVVMGRPARVVREVTEKDLERIHEGEESYVQNTERFARELRRLPG